MYIFEQKLPFTNNRLEPGQIMLAGSDVKRR
jgi:hypothetical protein